MRYQKVSDIRQFFVDELNDEAFTTDKTGSRTIELIGASFVADEASIFGVPNQEYIDAEIKWYESQSTNIYDIHGPDQNPPAAWKYAADKHGNINSNYGKLVFSEEYFQQFQSAVFELDCNRDTRRATMVYNRPSIWTEFDKGDMSDFICTNAVTYYIRDDLVNAVVQMRSNDVVFGYKNDYAWQQYMIKKVCNLYNKLNPLDDVYPGMLFWQVQNLHVYEKHFHLVDPSWKDK
jgi:thymidylate synthase